jgi:hypothetical protein
MFHLQLTVTLIPADNSIVEAPSHQRPAVSRTIPSRDLVSVGMTPDEVRRLLGEPSGGFLIGFGAGFAFLRMEYPRLGITIDFSGGLTSSEAVDRITKYNPTK